MTQMPPVYSQSPDLTIRKLLIDVEKGFPRHWAGDAFTSQYYNAFSMSFPAGEQAFIDSVRDCLPFLPSDSRYDTLREAAKQFIGQEATHRRVHARYNEQLAQQGLINHWEGWIAKRLAKYKAQKLHPLNFLATTAAYEHMTAIFADLHLSRPDLLAKATPDMQQLWRWHASEESEHRSVAFDLYQACGGRNRNRVIAFLFALVWFTTEAGKQTLSNLSRDKTLWHPSTWWSAIRYFWHPTKGMVWAVIPPTMSYLRKDFHPWKNHSLAPARQWLNANAPCWQAIGAG